MFSGTKSKLSGPGSKLRPALTCLTLAVVLSCIFAVRPSFASDVIITDLGTLGGASSSAVKINDAGQVVGDSAIPSGQSHAFIWQGGVMTDIGALTGRPESFAVDINEKGRALVNAGTPFIWVGGSVIDLGSVFGVNCEAAAINVRGQVVATDTMPNGYPRAAIWEYAWTQLGIMRSNDSFATGINDYGFVIGFANALRPRGFIKGSPYAPQYPMTDLGTLGGPECMPSAVNNNQQVTGWSTTRQNKRHAFLWQNRAMRDLGTLGGSASEAYALNGAGQVVGMSLDADGNQRAFIWRCGTMTDLGTLGGRAACAVDINEAGQVTGWSETFSGERHSFIWQDGAMTDLGTLGGQESVPADINNIGQVAGWSQDSSWERHAVVWDTVQTVKYSIGVSNDPAGCGTVEITPESADGLYESGSVVTLIAKPDPGYAFTCWCGDVHANTATVEITMDSDKSVTANFAVLCTGGSFTAEVAGNDKKGSAALPVHVELGGCGSDTAPVLNLTDPDGNSTACEMEPLGNGKDAWKCKVKFSREMPAGDYTVEVVREGVVFDPPIIQSFNYNPDEGRSGK